MPFPITKKRFYPIVGLLLLLFIIWNVFIDVDKTHQRLSTISSAPIVDELVAYGVNLTPGGTVTPEDIEAGKYPIEAVEVGKNNYVIDVPRQIGRLWRFDSNGDGLIDQNDPFYAHAAIGIISSDGKTIKFILWKDAGIRALVLDPGHLTPEKGSGSLPMGFWAVHSTVVTADGYRWLTYHVAVPTAFVDKLTTSDPKQRIIQTTR